MDGVLVIDKPAGLSSHDVVSRARRATGLDRIGHTGTLDPFATGVLPLVFGRATRLARYFTAAEKVYDAVVCLGIGTDTYDASGRVLSSSDAPIGLASVEAALERFRGAYAQAPPPFSAKKIDGVRAYRLARQRRPVQPAPVSVTVHSLRLVSFEYPIVKLQIVSSAGFYVRALAHELGQVLGGGAHLQDLRRVRSGDFTLDQTVPLATLEEQGVGALGQLIPLHQLLPQFPPITVTEEGARRAAHGNEISPAHVISPVLGAADLVRLLDRDGNLLALARPSLESGVLHPAVVLV